MLNRLALVLGLHGKVIAYQVKTTRDPGSFNAKTVLLGAKGLWRKIIDSRRDLGVFPQNVPIETVYVCDDSPSEDDDVGGGAQRVSSAQLLQVLADERLRWNLADWRCSPYAALVDELLVGAGLSDGEFEIVWRNLHFVTSQDGRTLGILDPSDGDVRRIREIANCIPRLVAESGKKNRWTKSELLRELGWRDPSVLRHSGQFPVDGLFQANSATQRVLQKVLATVSSGYASLIGPPGSGKSTLLAAGVFQVPQTILVRYLAFVPTEEHGLGRAEASDFLSDVIRQLKQSHSIEMVPGTELRELREQFEGALRACSRRFKEDGSKTVILVDGLDHVPREETPIRSFLSELPLPHAVPEGVVFLLSTQRLDLGEDMPGEVAVQAARPDRCVTISPLSREAIHSLAAACGVPADVDRVELYERCAGHPLSARYIIRGLLAANTSTARREWLRRGPAYGDDVEAVYSRAWRELDSNIDAQRALAYLALVEGAITTASLERMVGRQATEAAWSAARHLMNRNKDHAWSIFHNSFRLFLREKTGLRYDLTDEAGINSRYAELAEMACHAGPQDPQRWMELRYRARAHDDARVAALATRAHFSSQLVEGRSVPEIHRDICLAFLSAKRLRDCRLVLNLMMARHETCMRLEAYGNEFFEALCRYRGIRPGV